jgi:hypothetical protein
MRAGIYLLETDQTNQPIAICLVTDQEYESYERLKSEAHRAKNERYVYRPGILFACIDGERVWNIS